MVAVTGGAPAAKHCNAREAARLTYAPVSEQDPPWGRMFDQRWYRIELPSAAERAGLYLHWPDNGETTAWWQGVPYIGLDVFHPWCALPAGGDEPLYLESMCSGFGLFPASPRLTPQGQLFTAPSLRRRNDTAWHTWHDLLVFEEILRHEYSRTLPPEKFAQIMTQCDVEFFFTSKLSWSQLNRFPLTSFVWRGHDGSEVLAHLASTGYNGQLTLKELHEAADTHRQAGVHPEALMPTGHGDGGGGPTPLHCERALRFANWANAPRTRWDRIEDFFDRLAARRADLPTYQGDLLYTPPIPYRGPEHSSGFLGLHGAPSVAAAWAQPLGPGAWILRLNETLGRRGLLELELEPGWQADIVDLSGRPLPGIRQPDGRLAITPYALIGVRLSRSVQEGDECA